MIEKLQPASSNALAQLHLKYLRTPFQGKPGRELLRQYYQAVSTEQGATGYVAIHKNKVNGYVCGVWDAAQLRKTLLLRSGVTVLFWGIMQILQKPSLVPGFLSRLKESENLSSPGNGYELRPIVVSPELRGSGLAADLTNRLLQDAAQRGFSKIYLFTEQDNQSANRFYQRFGFKQVSEISRSGQIYIHYEHSTEGFK